jgi:8-oxo-dGTP pyrophosphatase MutT (NUDIX family)
MADRFMVVPAVYVYLLRETAAGREVLLHLRANTGFMDGCWAAVAGHVERGESVYDAAAREAAEEVGVADLALEPWCAMQRRRPTGDPLDERVDYFFTATSWSGEPRIIEPHKSADLRWFPLAALPDPVVPHELVVLESIRAGAVPPILVHGF